MAILSDRDVRERLAKGDFIIEPLEQHQIGPCSVDLRLGNRFRVFATSDKTVIDPLDYDDKFIRERIDSKGAKVEEHEYSTVYEVSKPFVLHPGDFVLASILERVKLPPDLAGKMEGRSSLGRIGLVVHVTAGWVDAGYDGHLTLELTNVGKLPIKLYPGMRIAQLVVEELKSPSENHYGVREQSKYSGEIGATQSKLNLDKEFRPKESLQ